MTPPSDGCIDQSRIDHSRIDDGGVDDGGIATVWAVAGVAVLATVMVFGLHLGSAIVARHRAESAADLAALAAAGLAAHGVATACARATEVAVAAGGRVTFCQLAQWDALVEVAVPVPVPLPGHADAAGRARAGPPDTAEVDR